MTSGSDDPSQLPLGEVERRCATETQRHREHLTNDSRFCLEIFRRAMRHAAVQPEHGSIAYADDEARNTLVRVYNGFVVVQINRRVTHWYDREEIVQQTWLRFWMAAANLQPFPTLEAALFYLKRTATSASIEATRQAMRRQREQSIQQLAGEQDDEERFASGSDPVTEHEQRRIRNRITELLHDSLDRRIFWMRHSFGIPPREIAAQLRNEGVMIRGREPTSRLVSDCLERCMRIVREDPEIHDFLRVD